jgi:DNA-binding transcriptional ArsR family regulator
MLEVVTEPQRAATLLPPIRRQILDRLAEPDSASGLARQLDLPRQKVNYHLRELERDGFVTFVEERRRGNCVERLVRATATHYLISPDVLGSLGDDDASSPDRFSAAYLIATAARLVRDVAVLRNRARRVRKQLPTLTLQSDVRFRTAADRNAMAEELAQAFAAITARYHDEHATRGRTYRFVVASHPTITKTEEQARAEENNDG